MPLERCTKNGASGWRWGSKGACYTGPGAKKRALKQGIAIEGPDEFKKKVNASLFSEPEFEEALAEYRTEIAQRLAAYLEE